MICPEGWCLEQRLGLTESDVEVLYSVGSLALALLGLLVTAALVCVTISYANSTKRMVEEMRRQNRPYVFLALYHHRFIVDRDVLVLKNAGTRIAYNVSIVVESDAKVRAMEEWRDAETGKVRETEDTVVPVSWLLSCRDGIGNLMPGEERALGSVKSGRDGVLEKLQCVIRYDDGAGMPYCQPITQTFHP